ncbi:MAG TPA: flagellar biosynthetic protein FliO [bacterium]|jgi:flagellar biogenesis protein FliO|nr:flagellar biosynthetic protein FliO [bacterium]
MYDRRHKIVLVVIILALLVSGFPKRQARSEEPALKQQESPITTGDSGENLTAGEEFHPGRLLLRMLAGLAVVLFLLFMLGKFFSRRLGLPPGTIRYLSIIDSVSLGSGKGVVVIQAGAKRYLLGIGGERIELLQELPDTELDDDSSTDPGFAAVFAQTKNIKPNRWQQTTEFIQRQVTRLRQEIGKGIKKEEGREL